MDQKLQPIGTLANQSVLPLPISPLPRPAYSASCRGRCELNHGTDGSVTSHTLILDHQRNGQAIWHLVKTPEKRLQELAFLNLSLNVNRVKPFVFLWNFPFILIQ